MTNPHSVSVSVSGSLLTATHQQKGNRGVMRISGLSAPMDGRCQAPTDGFTACPRSASPPDKPGSGSSATSLTRSTKAPEKHPTHPTHPTHPSLSLSPSPDKPGSGSSATHLTRGTGPSATPLTHAPKKSRSISPRLLPDKKRTLLLLLVLNLFP